ncbi:hypothetical protein MRX96_014413 [Rhipicephalus microplus]
MHERKHGVCTGEPKKAGPLARDPWNWPRVHLPRPMHEESPWRPNIVATDVAETLPRLPWKTRSSSGFPVGLARGPFNRARFAWTASGAGPSGAAARPLPPSDVNAERIVMWPGRRVISFSGTDTTRRARLRAAKRGGDDCGNVTTACRASLSFPPSFLLLPFCERSSLGLRSLRRAVFCPSSRDSAEVYTARVALDKLACARQKRAAPANLPVAVRSQVRRSLARERRLAAIMRARSPPQSRLRGA